MVESEFQIYKSAAVAVSFAAAILLQWLLPLNRRNGIPRNWRVNLPIGIANGIVVSLFCGGCACAVSRYAADHGYGLLNAFSVPTFVGIALAVLILDFVAWAWHMANHRIRFLWYFHRLHHSDSVYDATTAVRFHLGEIGISLGVRMAVVAALGLPVIGILAFEMIYAFFNFFEHSSTKLPSRLSEGLALIFVTPELHRIHHSANRDHLNTNFGTILSIWDRLLRTLLPRVNNEQFAVGLPEVIP